MLKTVLVGLAMLVSTSVAMANCYEGIGCDDSDNFQRSDLRRLSCHALWEVRNTIYQQNGYCFETDQAIANFGNEGCYVTSQAAVRLNAYERDNVATIRNVERSKGCN